MSEPAKRRRFQFRLSTLVWIITFAAVILGWLATSNLREAKIKQLNSQNRALTTQLDATTSELDRAVRMMNVMEKQNGQNHAQD